MNKGIAATIAGGLALAAHGAGAQEAAPMPTTIVYSDEGMSRMADLPMGVHRIEGSNVVVSGHQKKGPLRIILFGPVGVVMQSAADTGKGADKVRSIEDALRFDARTTAVELTQAILAEPAFHEHFSLSTEGSHGTLTVTPFIILTFANEPDVRPYIALKTRLATGAPGESPKALKYFCCEGKALPLIGENGLAENDGAARKALLTAELETAIRVMLQDRTQPYPRDKDTRITVSGRWPFAGKPFKMKAYDLGKFGTYSLLGFAPGALTFGGVNIAEPDSFEIIPAEKK